MRVTSTITVIALAVLAAVSGADAENLPLKPTRTFELEATEGTWMSLDVSPDGQHIVFDLLGDIYLMPAAGGRACPLTRSMAFDTQPVFSPDGDEIVFVSDRSGAENLWVVSINGRPSRQVSHHKENRVFISPAWSADGSRIFGTIFRADLNAYGLRAFDATGEGQSGGERVIPVRATADQDREAWASVLGAVASPDGEHLYYARHRGAFGEDVAQWAIHRFELATGTDEAVVARIDRRLDGENQSFFRPQLSPDGRLLAYAARHHGRTGLRLRDLSTGEDRWVAYPVQRDQLGATPWQDLIPGYTFTPDGDALVFSHQGRIRRLALDSGETTTIPFTAPVSVGLGPELRVSIDQETGPVRARLIQAPVQSPEGTTLAFSALGRIYTQTLDGRSKPVPLTDTKQPQFHPAWSPDGQHIAFVTWAAGPGGHVWIVDAEGGQPPRRLTNAADFYTDPIFSPAGDAVVVQRASHEGRMARYMEYGALREAALISIPLAGGEFRVIARDEMGRVTFAGDPRQPAVALANGVHAIEAGSGEQRRLISVRGPGWYFEEGPARVEEVAVSPDGRWALARNAQQLHLIAVPPPDAGPVDLSHASAEHRQISGIGADFFGWADGGRTITWTVGSTYHRCPLVRLNDAAAEVGTGAPPMLPYGCGAVEQFEAVVEVPRDTPRGNLLLRGATVIPMNGRPAVEAADLLVVDDRIAAVGAAGEVPLPDGATVLDVRGRYIVPGFIDVHNHLADIRRDVLDLEAWGPAANLAYGVTTSFDPSPLSIDMLAYEDLVDAGLMVGSRIHSTGPAIFSFNRFESRAEVENVLRRYRDHYRTRNIKMYRSGNRRVRQWVAMAARDLGMMPTTEGALAMKLGLSQVIDGFAGLEHELAAKPLGHDVVQLMASSGVSYTPTLVISAGPDAQNYFIARDHPAASRKLARFWPGFVVDGKLRKATWRPLDEYSFPAAAADAARIARAGGRVAVGAHGNHPGLGTHWEMEALAMGGMTPLEVLRAATIHGAEAIGRGAEFGSLEAGKYADLVILSADPREAVRNTRSIEQVMKNGRLYDAATLDEVWPRRRAFPRPWFRRGSSNKAPAQSDSEG